MNEKFMSKDTLRQCFKSNPDGAGYMYPSEGKVHIRKGFMDFQSFWNALNRTRAEYGDSIPYVMHFRISTQAGVNKQCCHPYPLSPRMPDLKKLSTSSSIGIAHNGIISLTSDRSVKDYNDTMKFITDYMTLLVKSIDWWKNPNIATALKVLCGSKLAVMGGDSHVELIGDFVLDKDDGCYYSNTSYLSPFFGKPAFCYDDEWKWYYDKKKKKYDFQDTYCPLLMDGDDSYCELCCSNKNCPTLKMMDDEYFGLKADEAMNGKKAGLS
jgi:hypothetical protein